MSDDLNQHYTPYEKGYTAGLGMAQSDPAMAQELEAMISNPNIDRDFHRGLVAGRQEAMHLLSARENEAKENAAFKRQLRKATEKKDRRDIDLGY